MYEYDGTKIHFDALRQRTEEFCKINGDMSPQRLIDLAGLKRVSRQSLRKFIYEGSAIRAHKDMKTLWRFFRDEHPGSIINSSGFAGSVDGSHIYHTLASFYSIEEKDVAQNIAKSLIGKYYFFSQPWKSWMNFSKELVIGSMEICSPNNPAHRNTVLEFNISTKIVNPRSKIVHDDEFNGFVFFQSGNVFLIGKDLQSNPVFMIFDSADVHPTTGKKIEWLRGNSFAGIGVYDHKSLKVALHYTRDFQSFPKGIYAREDDKLDFFTQYCLYHFNE